MGYHCNITYNNKGNFIPWSNSQVHNTPTTIVNFGDNHKLHWSCLKIVSKSNGWVTNTIWKHSMTLNNNHILLLHPINEKTHMHDNGEIMVKYQYGNLFVSGNTINIVFVFCVVDIYVFMIL